MKDYSQNREQEKILNFCNGVTGTVLDIGANDGKTLSNSLALIENGWSAVLVEPSEISFNKLSHLHVLNERIICIHAAISDTEGIVDFYESGSHLSPDDHSLLSTMNKSELKRWEGSNNHFEAKQTESITFKTLLSKSPYKKFEFITIDAEGQDYDILQQIDLNEVGCICLCIESNSIEDEKYISYCQKFGMKLSYKNHENLIFTK